ncbi:FAD-binding monooxygenase [Talaromyces pinophilus]|uniref:FAD-binding monooxygenase n=1 Tax=Talaromyces pinophilus TaxID=128442 RepID=A0A6V8HAU4_TALPI|nr:FAD-binding monooxygenase [Talaromyces pinophilus]
MAPLKVLICGAGITGNTLAFWLSKIGYEVTVIERFPGLRLPVYKLIYEGRLPFDATEERAGYIFGIYAKSINQSNDYAEVTFSNGAQELFDIVIGADGQGSHTRKMMLDDKGLDDIPRVDPFQPLGAFAGYFKVNGDCRKGEGYDATMYMATQSRSIMTRRHDPHKYQAYLFCNSSSSERLNAAKKGDIAEE